MKIQVAGTGTFRSEVKPQKMQGVDSVVTDKSFLFGKVYFGQSVWCNLDFITGSDTTNQKELIVLFSLFLLNFSGGWLNFWGT